MYLDVKGLVTCGVGNLIDSSAQACALPWFHESAGRPASRYEIAVAWDGVKQARAGQAAAAYARLNDLRLSDEAIDELVWRQVLGSHEHLSETFVGFGQWPADAQLAAHSMAWAAGAGWGGKFPKCVALLAAKGFAAVGNVEGGGSGVSAAATPSGLRVEGHAECDLRTAGNPGVIPRNALNRCHWIAAGSELARVAG